MLIVNIFDTVWFLTENGQDTGLFWRVYHVCASFIKLKHLVFETQTSASVVKSAFSLHGFYTKTYELSREKGYSQYPIEICDILLRHLICVPLIPMTYRHITW